MCCILSVTDAISLFLASIANFLIAFLFMCYILQSSLSAQCNYCVFFQFIHQFLLHLGKELVNILFCLNRICSSSCYIADGNILTSLCLYFRRCRCRINRIFTRYYRCDRWFRCRLMCPLIFIYLIQTLDF